MTHLLARVALLGPSTGITGLIVGLCVACVGTAHAASEGELNPLEAQIKAVYLYRFAGHVEWPPQAFVATAEPFTIGVVGATDVFEELNKLIVGRSVNERPVAVRVLRPDAPASGVQLVYVGGSDIDQLRQVLKSYQDVPALTISDAPGAMEAGSVINFVLVDNKLRFEISLSNAEQHGLKVSARLLAVAQRVVPGKP